MTDIPRELDPPVAWKNGQFIPQAELSVSYADQGVVHGVAVTEMVRTFRGELFELDRHLARFFQSAESVHIPVAWEHDALVANCRDIANLNRMMLADGEELGLIISATPGLNPTYTGEPGEAEPTAFIHTFRLPTDLWSEATRAGQHLAISNVPQIPTSSIPVTAKTRSRLGWYLADQEVSQRLSAPRRNRSRRKSNPISLAVP